MTAPLTPTRQTPVGTVTGPLVAAIEHTWAAIQVRHPDVPDVVLTLGNGSTRPGQLTLGHFHAGKWATRDTSAEAQTRLPELFVGGEGLAAGPRELLGTLLHEAAHGVAATRGVKDTSRQGRYHNTRYRDLAVELGLGVERDPRIGWSLTTVPDSTAALYSEHITQLGEAMRAHRLADAHGTGRGPSSNNGLVATCECDPPRKIRLSRTAYDSGPVICGVCEAEFTNPDTEPSVTPAREGHVLMTSSTDHSTSQASVADQVELDAQLRWLTYLHSIDIPAEQPQQWQQALELLRQRAQRARAVLEEREREHRQVLNAALATLGDYRRSMPELDEDELVERAAATASPTIEAPWPLAGDEDGATEHAVLAEPVTDAHIDAAPTEATRRLLIETAAAQHAIDKLRGTHADTARDATGMWQEYVQVHGYDETAAESAAWLETYEGVQAVYDNAYNDAEYQAGQRAEQRRTDGKAPTPEQRASNRAVDPRTGVYQDGLDALVAATPDRAAHAANTPDDLDRLRARLTAEHPPERREREEASGRVDEAAADTTQQHRLDDDNAEHGDQLSARQHAADEPHRHVHNAVLHSHAVQAADGHDQTGRNDTAQDDPARRDPLRRARIAVDSLAAHRRELDGRRQTDAARAEQMTRWHQDDHHRDDPQRGAAAEAREATR
jgi:hypothetical protein